MEQNDLVKIATARYFQAINEASKNGNTVLIRKINHSDYEHARFCIFQNQTTLELEMISSEETAEQYAQSGNYNLLLDWSTYYPFAQKSPVAAYIIPSSLSAGEKVYVEDMIEDTLSKSGYATWNGKDLDFLQ